MYSEDLVEQLIPAVFDSTYAWGLQNPIAPDADMPKVKYKSPKEATTFWCHLIDIRCAWEQAALSLKERRALYLYHSIGWTQQEIADYEQVSKKQINKRLSQGIAQLTAVLNDDGV